MTKAGEQLRAWRVRWEAQCAADAEQERQRMEREVQAAWAPLCAEFEANVGVPLVVTLPDRQHVPRLSADGVSARPLAWTVTNAGASMTPLYPYAPQVKWSAIAMLLAKDGKP